METKKRAMVIVAAVLLGAGVAGADIVELPLACEGVYDFNQPYWTTDFDLGVTFTEISNVYIDWSGEITSGLAIYYSDPNAPFPMNVGIYAAMGYLRITEVWGGEQLIQTLSHSTACLKYHREHRLGQTCSTGEVLLRLVTRNRLSLVRMSSMVL